MNKKERLKIKINIVIIRPFKLFHETDSHMLTCTVQCHSGSAEIMLNHFTLIKYQRAAYLLT